MQWRGLALALRLCVLTLLALFGATACGGTTSEPSSGSENNAGESALGGPCVPQDEYQTSFRGFALDEVSIERSLQCESRRCVINHFQGRVSCPYGQADPTTGKSLPIHDPERCRIPGASGKDPRDGIEVEVPPQLANRRPVDAVYCSCQCDGPDPTAEYCVCPAGFDCVKLVAFGDGDLPGFYCERTGTHFDPTVTGEECSAASRNCGAGNPPYDR